MLPTFADLAGIEWPEKLPIDGKSFAPILKSKEHNERKWILAMGSHSGMVGDDGMIRNWYSFRDRVIRGKQYKVYVDTLKQIHRLYDMIGDPYELNNLIYSASFLEVLSVLAPIMLAKFKEVNNSYPLPHQWS